MPRKLLALYLGGFDSLIRIFGVMITFGALTAGINLISEAIRAGFTGEWTESGWDKLVVLLFLPVIARISVAVGGFKREIPDFTPLPPGRPPSPRSLPAGR